MPSPLAIAQLLRRLPLQGFHYFDIAIDIDVDIDIVIDTVIDTVFDIDIDSIIMLASSTCS